MNPSGRWAVKGSQHVKRTKQYNEWRQWHLYIARPPEAILSSCSGTHFDQSDFERALWIWQRRPKRPSCTRFWLRLACIFAPAAAAAFLHLHLAQPFADVLLITTSVASFVLLFLYCQGEAEWERWHADYSRAIDQMLSASSQGI
jgi:hypothetical protein